MIYTVFPSDPDELPQDFPTYSAAVAYGNDVFGEGCFVVSSTSGECL